ncbi:MAG TPA: SdrD B-like domain-containing protein [Candidatus Paceibacterota bacterium]|nr:SdrD B-like domain-containing protein [Candidatus Paceibacterota bacterium]
MHRYIPGVSSALLGLAFLVLPAFASASSATWYVDASASGTHDGTSQATAFLHIQDAITAASGGDIIKVYPGHYQETAPNSTLTTSGSAGTYTFGLFLPLSKPGLTIEGVDSSGNPITNGNSTQADITTVGDADFGPDGIMVEGANDTIQGLKINGNLDPTSNQESDNKTIEVIGDNFTLQYSTTNVPNGGGSVYIDDFSSGGITVQSYHILNNVFHDGTSVDIASGAGETGAVSGREIMDNDWDLGNNGYNAISFNGSGGVAWFVNPVGGAIIKNNSFKNSTQYIRQRGTVADQSQFDWKSYWNDNTFDHAAIALDNEGTFDVRSYAYSTFTNVRRIGGTIQGEIKDSDGVDHAQAGDTILVKAGTYPENVNVDRALTLKGANAGIVGTSTRSAESIIADGGTGGVDLSVNADNVTVDGFTFEGSLTNAAAANTGVFINAAQKNVTVKNNVITDNSIGMYPNCSSNCLVQGNEFKANNRAGAAGGAGIYSDEGVNGLTIDQNDFTGHTINSAVILASAAAGTNKNVTFTNNTIESNNADNSMVYIVDLAGGTFSGNKITQPGATAIKFATADSNITVTNNILTGSAWGVKIINGTDDGLGAIVADSSNITINNNDVSGDTTAGIANLGGYSGTLDGTCNWWGDASGPSSVGSGSGDNVTTNVTYTPWLATSNLSGDCTGGTTPPPQPQVHIYKYVDGVMATAQATNNAVFPMETTFNSPNLGSVTNEPFTLSPTGWGNSDSAYEASFVGSNAGADYEADEVLGGPVVGSQCDGTHAYKLDGYTTGDSLESAAAATPSTDSNPSFTNLQSDQYVIVWNKTCPTTGSLVITKDATGGDGTFHFTSTDIPGYHTFTIPTSGGTGSITIPNLAPGTYHISEVSQSGWTQSDNECSAVSVSASADAATCTVSNSKNPKLGQIRGSVFEDWDGDSSPFETKWEVGLKGWTVYIDANHSGSLDSGDPTATTNAQGAYTFKNLPPGSYTVREVVKSGWIPTYPSTTVSSDSYTFSLSAGQIAKKKDFGNFKLGSISGTVFEDRNGNGKQGNNEGGLAGWTVDLMKGNTVIDTTTTKNNGNYSFSNLGPGTYKVMEVIQGGWKRTTGNPDAIKITSAKDAKNKNFGDKQKNQ